MRPRVLYELSKSLSLLLEEGLRGGKGERRVPVLLCHPLDPLEDPSTLEGGTIGVLYLSRLIPERRYPQAGLSLRRGVGQEAQLELPGLWLSARYLFLVAGGSLDDQLTAMATAVQTLHDHPYVRLQLEARDAGAPEARGAEGPRPEGEGMALPLRLVDDKEGWKEIGLHEHRLTIAFEVTFQIPSSRAEPAARTHERDLEVNLELEGWGEA